MSTPMSTIDKAAAAWGCDPCEGKALPDWVKALAEACDETSLRKTAKKLDVSPAIVSLAVNNKREKLDFIKSKALSILMVTMVACPVLGVMGMGECLQEQARPFSSANPQRVRLFRACRDGCPYYKEKKQ